MVLTLTLHLTETEARRICELVTLDRESCTDGLAAYLDAKLAAALAEETLREARAMERTDLSEMVAKIRATQKEKAR